MQVEDGALILRAKFMVRPDDQQFVVRREVLSRIKRALEEKGIRFAPRQVLVHVAQPSRDSGRAGSDPGERESRADRCGSRRGGGRPCPGPRSPTLPRFPPSGNPRSAGRSISILRSTSREDRCCFPRDACHAPPIDSSTGVVDTLLAGRGSAYTSDGAQLTAARLRGPAGRGRR